MFVVFISFVVMYFLTLSLSCFIVHVWVTLIRSILKFDFLLLFWWRHSSLRLMCLYKCYPFVIFLSASVTINLSWKVTMNVPAVFLNLMHINITDIHCSLISYIPISNTIFDIVLWFSYWYNCLVSY